MIFVYSFIHLYLYIKQKLYKYIYIYSYRRKFRSQTSDNMGREREEQRRSKKIREEARRSEKRKSQKKEDAGARKGRKVANHSVFPLISGAGGSKSRLAKAAGAEPSGQMRDEKLHAVVARSTFPSQNVLQNTPTSDHFRKLRCRKNARRCGAKHISKSKCTKHTNVGQLSGSWDVKKMHAVVARSTFPSQNVKKRHVQTTLERSGVFCVAGARDCAPCQKRVKREGFVAD